MYAHWARHVPKEIPKYKSNTVNLLSLTFPSFFRTDVEEPEILYQLGMVAHTCNPSTQEAEAKGP
jgi:hypothetical protein